MVVATGREVSASAPRNDSYNWNNVLNEALEDHSDVSFLVSAGDQVNYGSTIPSESEWS